MSNVEKGLRIIEILVNSAGVDIEPLEGILRKNVNEVSKKDEMEQLEELFNKAVNGFFHCAAQKITFTNLRLTFAFFIKV